MWRHNENLNKSSLFEKNLIGIAGDPYGGEYLHYRIIVDALDTIVEAYNKACSVFSAENFHVADLFRIIDNEKDLHSIVFSNEKDKTIVMAIIEKAILVTADLTYNTKDETFYELFLYALDASLKEICGDKIDKEWCRKAIASTLEIIGFEIRDKMLYKVKDEKTTTTLLFDLCWVGGEDDIKFMMPNLFGIDKEKFRELIDNAWDFAESFDMDMLWEVWQAEK